MNKLERTARALEILCPEATWKPVSVPARFRSSKRWVVAREGADRRTARPDARAASRDDPRSAGASDDTLPS